MARRRARRMNRSAEMSEMKGKKCCGGGAGIVAHLLLLVGIYVLSWGFLGTSSWRVILKDPIFWGLFLIFAAFCMFKKAKMHMMQMYHAR
jgi:hypothetical protein